MTDFAERGSLGVRELQPPLRLGLQDAIFGGQIFDPRQQLLVHHPRDEGQNTCPIHSSSTPAESQLFAQKIVASDARRGYAGDGQTHRLFYSSNFLTVRDEENNEQFYDWRSCWLACCRLT